MILQNNSSIFFPKAPKNHLSYTSAVPSSYLRVINRVSSALINVEVTHMIRRRPEAFSLQVYRKRVPTKSKEYTWPVGAQPFCHFLLRTISFNFDFMNVQELITIDAVEQWKRLMVPGDRT